MKFFDGESLSFAEKALVAGVYEAAFYLPSTSQDDTRKTKWDYDFGCLLAYDASDGAYLKRAWASVHCRRLFWEDAQVFVMILRGQNGPS